MTSKQLLFVNILILSVYSFLWFNDGDYFDAFVVGMFLILSIDRLKEVLDD